MWQSHRMECYSAIKKDKLLILTTVGINLRIIMSEKEPDQRKKKKVHASIKSLKKDFIKSRKSM